MSQMNGRIHYKVNVTGYKILNRGGGPFVGHKLKTGSCFLLEESTKRLRSSSRGALGGFVRVCFQPRYELLQIIRRQCLFRVEHGRGLRYRRHGGKIIRNVIGDRLNGSGNKWTAELPHLNFISVRRRTCPPSHTNRSAGAADVLNDDWLP